MLVRGYKTELNPNNRQRTLLNQGTGNARFAFNWALAEKLHAFENKLKIPNALELHRKINSLKKEHYPFLYLTSKCCTQEALRDCDKAFDNFFRRCKQKIKGKKGFPKFKSKKNEKQSFRLTGSIKVLDGGYVQLPRIGKIKLFEKDYLPKDTKILSATISKRADKWFVSLQVEEDVKQTVEPLNDVVGVDLGIKTLATCSDSVIYENPKALKTNLRKLKRKSRQFSRKQKGSKNREKAKQKLAKLHYRISNIRKDILHKITSQIVSENQTIILEDLKVSNMMKNHCLAQAISDVGMFEFRRQIEYKAKWYGKEVVFVNTFYPSSKLCSSCGWKNETLTLTDRVFECKVCLAKLDRDFNASLNLKHFYAGSSPEIYACGDGSSEKEISLSPSTKQESNRKSSFRFL